MSEHPISISNLNDFIFCPVSIYFHFLEEEDVFLLQETAQINGSAAHEKSDQGTYSSRRSILQGAPVYSEQYDLFGKIDVFDVETGTLTERKKRITTVYDGYVFQVYAQYFALTEMGYSVSQLRLYSMDDHRVFPLPLPQEDPAMLSAFDALLQQIHAFSFELFRQTNRSKCEHCIYEPLCSYSCRKELSL